MMKELEFLPMSDIKDKIISLCGDNSLPWMPLIIIIHAIHPHSVFYYLITYLISSLLSTG